MVIFIYNWGFEHSMRLWAEYSFCVRGTLKGREYLGPPKIVDKFISIPYSPHIYLTISKNKLTD